MNSKKAKAIRALVAYDVAKYEEKSGRKVTPEEYRKFYQSVKKRIKNGEFN